MYREGVKREGFSLMDWVERGEGLKRARLWLFWSRYLQHKDAQVMLPHGGASPKHGIHAGGGLCWPSCADDAASPHPEKQASTPDILHKLKYVFQWKGAMDA